MRDATQGMSATLLAAQKSVGTGALGNRPLWRIVLTRAGQTTRTYTNRDRLIKISRHVEEEDHGEATIYLDNSDLTVTTDFEQYQGVISNGYETSAGDEYSPCAPLKVVWQQSYSAPGVVLLVLYLIGLADQMAQDKAESEYTQLSTDTNTIQTLMTAIAAKTLAPYTSYSAITLTVDSADSIINAFIPADYFSVSLNEDRWSKLEELLRHTGCKIRAEDDGALHVFDPLITGTTYDYEYRLLVDGYHSFFDKTIRERFVNPNKEIVKSADNHSPSYSGNSTSATSYALAPKIRTTVRRLPSNAMADLIAAAKIETDELDAERGSINVPMNCGQEVFDYIKVTDARAGDSRVGNVQYIERNCDMTKPFGQGGFDMAVRFGKLAIQALPFYSMAAALSAGEMKVSMQTVERLIATYNYILENILALFKNQETLFSYVSRHDYNIDRITEVLADHERRIIVLELEAETRVIGVIAVDATTDLTVADGKAYIPIPAAFNGMNLIRAQAMVITPGTTNPTTIDIYNVTKSQDMLSTAISIASGATVGTVGTIDITKDDVATNDVLRVDVTTMSTTAPKGLLIILEFQLP